MRKTILSLLLIFFLCLSVRAQIVGSTNRQSSAPAQRAGLSYGVSAVGSFEFNRGNEYLYYDHSIGLWGDLGYHLSQKLYFGGSLGLQYRDLPDSYISEYSNEQKMAVRLMAGVRYFFFNSASSLFADYRAGINVAGPLSKYGRSELGLGYIWNNNWEVAAGLENELWNATDSFSELVKSRGFYVRLGYRFR